jgi:hypothetical protein
MRLAVMSSCRVGLPWIEEGAAPGNEKEAGPEPNTTCHEAVWRRWTPSRQPVRRRHREWMLQRKEERASLCRVGWLHPDERKKAAAHRDNVKRKGAAPARRPSC